MRREFDTRYYKVIKKIVPDSLNNTDHTYLAKRIASFSKQTDAQNANVIGKQQRRMELADLARRIVFKGVPYPQRDPSTLPVWSDPDA